MPNYLKMVFPDSVAPIFADWFSGELRYLSLKFYTGKLVCECEALQAAWLARMREPGSTAYAN